METWLEPQPIHVPDELRRAVGGHPLVAELLVRRGIADVETARRFLDPALYAPAAPQELPGVPEATERLVRAVRGGERILVWGDFDVDGLASTAILVESLEALGASVRYHIPGRGAGHGVQADVLRTLAVGAHRPDLVLTCDTGINATGAVAYARGAGIDVVITDHHALPAELPAAQAIVNPCFLPAAHPLRTLPGAGCAYVVAAALAAALGQGDVERSLDLLALAIVADVATLQGDVRYYLQRGLAALRQTSRLGLKALYEVAGLDAAGLDEEHLGFGLSPRLNALGRLAEARAGVELFLTADLTRARTIAAEMEGLNNRRQLLTSQVLQAAREQVERDPAALRAPVILAAHPTWPGGVIGLVAGRLAERYGKPAVVMTTPPGEAARGSARSVPGIDIAAAIASAGDLLAGHGGHPMAAGFSLRPENMGEFRARLLADVSRRAAAAPPPASLAIDAFLGLPDVTPGLVRELNRLAPFGPGNPAVLLAARRLRIIGHSAVGRTGEHRRLVLRDAAGHEQKVFWWQAGDAPVPEGIVDLAFNVRASNYRGRDEVTVEWVAARVVEAAAPALRAPAPTYAVFDHRDDPAPAAALAALRSLAPVQVWAEGLRSDASSLSSQPGLRSDDFRSEGLRSDDLNRSSSGHGPIPPVEGAVDRLHLAPAADLALWTAPPGPQELAEILRAAAPQRVHLFAVDPGNDAVTPFLQRLAGLIKYALAHYDGAFDAALLARLAAATAQRPLAVRCALRWLVAQGQLRSLREEDGTWHLAAGDRTTGERASGAAAEEAARQLAEVLRETAAYRAYFRSAEPYLLLGAEPSSPASPSPSTPTST